MLWDMRTSQPFLGFHEGVTWGHAARCHLSRSVKSCVGCVGIKWMSVWGLWLWHGPKPLEWRQWQYLRHLWRAQHRQHSSTPHTLRALGHLSPVCQPLERTVRSDGSLMTRKLIYSVTCHSSHSFLWICFDWSVTAHVHNYWSHVAGGNKKIRVKTKNNEL